MLPGNECPYDTGTYINEYHSTGHGGLKNRFLTGSTLGGCGNLERSDFEQFLTWADVVILNELILTVFALGRCGGLERTDF